MDLQVNVPTDHIPRANGPVATILGPHPGHGCVSIFKYFQFCRLRLPPFLSPYQLDAYWPGDPEGYDDEVYDLTPRGRASWENYAVWPCRLRSVRAELFHVVGDGLAWYARFLGHGRKLITIHDLFGYLHVIGKLNLEHFNARRRLMIKECVGQIRTAHHLLAVSRYTADSLVRELGLDPAKIAVTPHWVDERYNVLDSETREVERRRWFGTASHVVLYVGKHSAYKNRIGAIQTFALVHKKLRDAVMYVVPGPLTDEETNYISQAQCPVRCLPRQTDGIHAPTLSPAELRCVYGVADVLIFPSFCEGFGWPPLEAMACGCPVVATTCTALGEVVGDAGLTVADPNDHKSLASLVLTVLRDPNTARDLRQRGLARAKSFHPTATLGLIAGVYRQLMNA